MAAAGERLRAWHSQIALMLSKNAAQESRRGMIWQQGYLELSVGLDQWETSYFVLDEAVGLRIFALGAQNHLKFFVGIKVIFNCTLVPASDKNQRTQNGPPVWPAHL